MLHYRTLCYIFIFIEKICISGHIKYKFMEFVLPSVAWLFENFMRKHRKWTARLPLSAGCFLIAQAGFFICCTTTVGLFWGIIILLNSMYQAVTFSFKVLQNFIVYESAEDRNLRTSFNRVKNSLSCNIFTRYYCNWDALRTCQRWTCFLEPCFFPRALKIV